MTPERLDEIEHALAGCPIKVPFPEVREIIALARRALTEPPMTAEEKAVVEAATVFVDYARGMEPSIIFGLPVVALARVVDELRASRKPKPRYFVRGCTILCSGGAGCSEPDAHGIGTLNSPRWAETVANLLNASEERE